MAFRQKIERAAASQTDEAALASIELFPFWGSGIAVAAGDRCKHNGILYKCLQAHTTQADWTPGSTPALWAAVSLESWPEWVQPLGAEDAYNTGDKVTFEGAHYISLIDGNVWSPTAYPQGWSVR